MGNRKGGNSKRTLLSKFDAAFPTIQRYFDLFRPKVHSRLAWVVVFAGVGVAAGPLWLGYLNGLVVRWTTIKITDPNPWIGVAMIALGLLYHLLFQATQKNGLISELADSQEKQEHDVSILKAAFSLYNEDKLNSLCDRLSTDDSYTTEQSDELYEFLNFLDQKTNQLLILETEEASSALRQSGNALLKFLAYNFWIYPRDQRGGKYRYVLYPNWNPEREGSGQPEEEAKYANKQRELDDAVEAFRKAFEHFLLTVKNAYKARFREIIRENQSRI